MATKFKEKRTRIGIGNVVAWGNVAACLFEGHVTENAKVVFAKKHSNLTLIPNP